MYRSSVVAYNGSEFIPQTEVEKRPGNSKAWSTTVDVFVFASDFYRIPVILVSDAPVWK